MMRAREIFENTRPLYGDFRQLMDYAKSIGVVLDVSCEDSSDTINLLGLYRTKGIKGVGADIMDRLCALADQHDKEIQLDAEGGSEGLFRYYERWGFELEQHVMDEMNDDPAYGGPWVMYRLPRAPLTEGYAQPVLFHGTTLPCLLGIVHDNRFGTGDFNQNRHCFTRAKHIAIRFAQRCSLNFFEANEVSEEMNEEDIAFLKEHYPLTLAEYEATQGYGHGVILVIDRNRLAHNYKIVPHDEGQGNDAQESYREWRREISRNNPREPWDAQHKYEFEERVTRPIQNAQRYIDGIFFRVPREWFAFKQAVEKMFPGTYSAAISFIDSKLVNKF